MSIEQDDPQKQFKEALDKLNLSKAIEAIKKLDSDSVYDGFASKLAQPGGFQVRADRGRRNKFYDCLLDHPALKKHPEVQAYAQALNEKIKVIEQCFDLIRTTLPQCAISSHPEDVQFWSHIELAAQGLAELKAAGNKSLDALKAKARAKQPFIMPEASVITLSNGAQINLDTAYSSTVNLLSLTLKMLAFEHKLLTNDQLLAPVKPEITQEHIDKAGTIQLFAMAWNSLEDIGARTLFFGGQVGGMDALGIARDTFPHEMYEKFPEPIIFHRRPTHDEVYDFAANRRQHSWAAQNTFHLLQGSVLRKAVIAKGAKPPALSAGPYVSEDEAVTLANLSEILSFNVFSDPDRHHGLTLREWVRGYCALKLMAKAKLKGKKSSLIYFDKAELIKGFVEYRIPKEYASKLVDNLSFGRGSRDLYDTPLIRSQDDRYWLLAEILITCNFVNVLFSRLGSLEVQLDKKGKGFEEKVVSFLVGLGYPCRPTKFNIDGAQYEYDALLLIEDSLFLIECKNNLLSCNHAVQALRYSKFIADTVKQVKRLEQGLKARPDVVESLFGRKLSDLTVVPMILNSLPYSRAPIDGVYVSDYSAFSKFLSESTISEHNWKDGKKQVRKVIHRLWVGERPSVKELLDHLAMPYQLKFVLGHLTYDSHPRYMSKDRIYWSGILDVNETALQQAKQDAPQLIESEAGLTHGPCP